MKKCGKCGANNADGSKFCVECGALMDSPRSITPQNQNMAGNPQGNGGYQGGGYQGGGGYQNGGYQGGGYQNVGPYRGGNGGPEVIYTNVTPRSIPIAIILSFVTCGIYLIFWICTLNNDINELAQDPSAPSGGMVILLSLVTCGIYGFIWYYKMGDKCDYISQRNGSSNIVYLLLGLFGLGLIALALMQDTVNKAVQ